MSDMSTYVNVAATVISSIMAAIVVYYQFRKKKLEVDDEEAVCHKDFQVLQTKVAVLEERINNEIEMLDKLETKLDQIRDQL